MLNKLFVERLGGAGRMSFLKQERSMKFKRWWSYILHNVKNYRIILRRVDFKDTLGMAKRWGKDIGQSFYELLFTGGNGLIKDVIMLFLVIFIFPLILILLFIYRQIKKIVKCIFLFGKMK